MTMTKPLKEKTLSNMLGKLFNEEFELTKEQHALYERLKEIEARKEEILNERDILQGLGEKEDLDFVSVDTETTTTTRVTFDRDEKIQSVEIKEEKKEKRTRMSQSEKMKAIDKLKEIMEQYGRPMKLSDIIEELANHGYEWNKVQSARKFITDSGILDSPYRGMYQLIRKF